MANIFDYLQWRGDLTLKQSGFNVVDNLILSMIAYVPFDGVVPAGIKRGAVTFSGAAELFSKLDLKKLPVRNPDDVRLLTAAAATRRFKNMLLSGYVNNIDIAAEKQFSALTVDTGDGSLFIAFRGTDLTLVGWKEDFNMTFLAQIPSQAEAVAYLDNAAAHSRGKLRIGGHSKGGNLAVYAAAFCRRSLQKRILSVYNNDGPGFAASVISQPGYQNVLDRLHTFIPQSSVVGMLLEHHEQYAVVHSTESGLMQHEAYSWSVLGTDFVRRESVTEESRFVGQTLKEWLYSIEPQRREQFFDALYAIISATDAKNLSELSADWLKTAKALSRTLKNIDAPTKKMLGEILGVLFESAKKNIGTLLPVRMQKKR